MRRAEFSRLTGLSPQFFNSLARRDQFPFLRRPIAEGRGWGSYSPKLAYMALLALGIADAGATQTQAGHFVDTEFEMLEAVGLTPAQFEAADIYLGYARLGVSEREPEAGRFSLGGVRRPLCGTLEDVTREIARLQAINGRGGLLGVVVVNASEHLRILRDRGLEQGLGGDLIDQAFAKEDARHEA